MVDLKCSCRKLPSTKSATLPISSNESLLEAFRESAPPALASSRIFRIAEAIGANAPAVGTFDPKGFKRNALLSYIARSTGRMVVPIVVCQLRSRNVAVFQNVVKNATRPKRGHAVYLALEVWIDLH
jgi:hypothetical protein